jgi:hypothetical protein
MSPNVEEEHYADERVYLLLGIVVAVVNVTFGVLALRDHAWKLATFMLSVGVTSVVATVKKWRCAR